MPALGLRTRLAWCRLLSHCFGAFEAARGGAMMMLSLLASLCYLTAFGLLMIAVMVITG